MARIPQMRCGAPCGFKVRYRSETGARESLGRVLRGAWKGGDAGNWSLVVYKCPGPRKGWHIGHSPRAIALVHEHMKKPLDNSGIMPL